MTQIGFCLLKRENLETSLSSIQKTICLQFIRKLLVQGKGLKFRLEFMEICITIHVMELHVIVCNDGASWKFSIMLIDVT